MLDSTNAKEDPEQDLPEQVRLGLIAGRIATAHMIEYYRRMGVKVTPQMTLAEEPREVPENPSEGIWGGFKLGLRP